MELFIIFLSVLEILKEEKFLSSEYGILEKRWIDNVSLASHIPTIVQDDRLLGMPCMGGWGICQALRAPAKLLNNHLYAYTLIE